MIEVQIAGRNYSLAVDKTQEAKVKALASHVDALLADLKRADPLMDRDRQLVLALLQVVADVDELRQQLDNQNTSVTRFHRDLADHLQTLLPKAGSSAVPTA